MWIKILLSSFSLHLPALNLTLAQLYFKLQDISSMTKGYLTWFSQFMNILKYNSPDLLRTGLSVSGVMVCISLCILK